MTEHRRAASRRRGGLSPVIALLVLAGACGGGSSPRRAAAGVAPATARATASTAPGSPAGPTPPGGTGAGCTTDMLMDPYGDAAGVVHTDSPSYRGALQPHDDPRYSVNPPSGGDHLSVAAPAGDYRSPKVPLDGFIVHSMEHGYVVVWHHPDLPAEQLDILAKVAAAYPKDVLLVERAAMDVPVAATAWHHRLLCPAAVAAPLTDFVRTYRNQGPEKVAHG